MGRPFEKELTSIHATLGWAFDQEIKDLRELIDSNSDKVFYIVGSGGSFSACSYAADLFQSKGIFAKAITPLAIHQNRVSVRDSNIIFISASGKNSDIISSYEAAILQDPNLVISLTLAQKNPLGRIAQRFSISKHFEFRIPTGKDGFLATNSLVAFFAILYQGISRSHDSDRIIDSLSEFDLNEIKSFAKKYYKRKTFVVLYGSWGAPVAIDLESKFSEAALGNVLISDFRNFGHGRHHWFDKQLKDSVLVLLVTPAEQKLAEKTASILPKEIPVITLSTQDNSMAASIELLIKSFYLVNEIGKRKGIDPGRPGVPNYGSKLYNLKYLRLINSSRTAKLSEDLAIERKMGDVTLITTKDRDVIAASLQNFIKNLSSTKFSGLILDYDGTLCTSEDRYHGISSEIRAAVSKLLDQGFVIGIATGRGQSVRKDLQSKISREHWDKVLIAYYNGSDIGTLANDNLPDKSSDPHPSLALIARKLKEDIWLQNRLQIELRPFQLTIEITSRHDWLSVRDSIRHIVMMSDLADVRMLESSHSCDIVIKSKASKLKILPACKTVAAQLGHNHEFLCLGDRGQWPGNDFELLSHNYSLSVDEVSPDLNTCWNLSSPGNRNISATLEYLSWLKVNNSDNCFHIAL